MTMSKDRVRFTLPCRYFQSGMRRSNGFNRSTMLGVLKKAFGMTWDEANGLMDHYPQGFEIECRPSQFGRFIVLRCETDEGINGVRDLYPRIVQPTKPTDTYQRVAERLNLHPDVIRSVIKLFHEDVSSHCFQKKPIIPKTIDVSQRPAQ